MSRWGLNTCFWVNCSFELNISFHLHPWCYSLVHHWKCVPFVSPVSSTDGDKKKRQKEKENQETNIVLPIKLATLKVRLKLKLKSKEIKLLNDRDSLYYTCCNISWREVFRGIMIIASPQLYNKELEREFGYFDDWVKTYELFRGKASEEDGTSDERFVGKFKVSGFIVLHASWSTPRWYVWSNSLRPHAGKILLVQTGRRWRRRLGWPRQYGLSGQQRDPIKQLSSSSYTGLRCLSAFSFLQIKSFLLKLGSLWPSRFPKTKYVTGCFKLLLRLILYIWIFKPSNIQRKRSRKSILFLFCRHRTCTQLTRMGKRTLTLFFGLARMKSETEIITSLNSWIQSLGGIKTV